MNRPRLQPHSPPRAPELPRAARWAVRLFTVLPLLALLLWAGSYLGRVGRLLNADLAPIASGEITRQIGHETRLGHIAYATLGALTLTDVRVSSKDTFAHSHGESALTADRVTIHYSLRALLFDSGNAAHALGDIVLERPNVLVERYPGNRYNFSDLLTPKTKPGKKPFAGRVIARNGTVRTRDYLAPARLGERPAYNVFTNVAATVDFGSTRVVYFDGSARGTQNKVATVVLRGDASRQTAGRFRILAQATDADAAYWTDYLKAFPTAHVLSGRADVNLTVSRLTKANVIPDLLGQVAVRNASVAVNDRTLVRLPLQNITGHATFTGNGVTANASLTFAGQPVLAAGTVFDFLHPQIALTASSARVDPARLSAGLPFIHLPPGARIIPGPVTARLTGMALNPTVSFDAASPALSYAGNIASNVRARGIYANHILSAPDITFRLNGTAPAALNLTALLTKTPTVLLAGRAQGVNLATLAVPPALAPQRPNLGGTADVAFLADNQGHPLRITANVSASNLRVRETTLRAARGRVVWTQGGALTVSRAVVDDPKGVVLASGTIPLTGTRAPWNLVVGAAGLDIAQLLTPYHVAGAGGIAYFQGRIVGTSTMPQAVGTARLYGARYGRYSVDSAEGQIAAGANGLRFQNVVVRRYPTEARVSGTVSRLASGNPTLGLDVALSEGSVQDFAALATEASGVKNPRAQAAALPDITGTAAGAFHIVGTVKSPAVTGRATITDATVNAYRVDKLSASVAFADNNLQISDVQAQAEGANATAHGHWNIKTGHIAAAFAVNGLALDRFDRLLQPYVDTDGLLDVSATIGGTLQSPTAQASVAATGLILNGQAFAPAVLAASYEDGVFAKTGDPWILTTRPVSGAATTYQIDTLRLFLPTPAHPRRQPALTLAARIPAGAPETFPHLIDTLRGSRLAQTAFGRRLLAQVDMLPAIPQGTFSVPTLSAQGPLSSPEVTATVQAANLAYGDTEAKSLHADLSYKGGVSSSGHVTAQASDLRASGVPVGDVTADAGFAGRVVTLNRLRATSERAFLEASGRADLDGGIGANLDASNVPLALLNRFLPPSRALSGEISDFSVTASGATRAPDLTASITLTTPTVTVIGGSGPPTSYSLDRIRSGAITLASSAPGGVQVLTVNDLAAFKNGKLAATASGSLPVRAFTASGTMPTAADGQPLEARLQVQDLSLLALLSPGIDPLKTGGRATAVFTARGLAAPQIAGTVTLTDGAFGLTGIDTGLNKIAGTVVIANGRATVQTLTGQSSKGGTFAVTGGVDLKPGGESHLLLALKNMFIDETSRNNLLSKAYASGFSGRINGGIALTGPLAAPMIASVPQLPLVITDANGTIPSAAPTPGAAGGPPLIDPRFHLRVALGSQENLISLRSSLLRADANGDVELTGQLSAPRLAAHLSIYKGQFLLPPSTRLRFVRPVGTIDLAYPRPSRDPAAGDAPTLEKRVDLTAEATVSVSPSELASTSSAVPNGVGETPAQFSAGASNPARLGGSQRYTITAHIYGLLDEPDRLTIDLTSSPGGLSKSQMLASLGQIGLYGSLLAGGSGVENAVKQQLASLFNQVALPALLDPITSGVGQALGLSDFSVDLLPNAPVQVTLTKQLAPRINVIYSRAFGSRAPGAVNSTLTPPQYTLSLGYQITNKLQITVSTDDQRDNGIGLQGVIAF